VRVCWCVREKKSREKKNHTCVGACVNLNPPPPYYHSPLACSLSHVCSHQCVLLMCCLCVANVLLMCLSHVPAHVFVLSPCCYQILHRLGGTQQGSKRKIWRFPRRISTRVKYQDNVTQSLSQSGFHNHLTTRRSLI
jgi:hypothetical protein